ncbi:MAG: PLP-dependent aspartate aminotransferase family protein [Chloroherpetonaceae bacterium]|nr:PLP-dependent aspartate aminotransferase family protein [Chloroherpetonaceae bacterium]
MSEGANQNAKMKLETGLIHLGDEFNTTSAVAPPIWQTSTYLAPEDPAAFSELAASINPTEFYSRHGNPTNAQVQAIIASLEHAEAALVTASGMGAVSAAVFASVKAGEHVVTQKILYAASMILFRDLLPKYGVEVTFVEATDTAAFEKAIRPNTKLIYLETPVNPLMTLTDLKAVSALAKKRGITTICDNTFASPINQRPIDLGIDVVIHSATKFLGGHSDLTAGAICGTKEFVKAAWRMMIIFGSSLASFDSWLLLRGLRTLSLRMERINANAIALADYLVSHPNIETVHFPFLKTHPQLSLAKSQMLGPSGMMSFEVRGESEEEKFDNAQSLLKKLRFPKNAVSLGGVETLIVHPASMWRYHYTPEQRKASGIGLGLIRLSVGIEHIDDLIGDFREAL